MISYSSLSRAGDRQVNEDAVGTTVQGDRYLFAVADGLGGHKRGAVASSYVVSRLLRAFEEVGDMDFSRFFTRTLRLIQQELAVIQREEGCPGGMLSTVAAAAVCGSTVTVAHVGDSRCYLLGPWGVRKRTLDHSVPQALALAGEIREQDIPHHPSRSKLLHCLGDGDEEPRIELLEARRGTKSLLLCSDGFWEYIGSQEIAAARRRSKTPQEWLERMEETVRAAGVGQNMDNYSALGVFLDK